MEPMQPDDFQPSAGYALVLPMPPGVNNRMFCAGKRMVLTPRYRAWKQDAVKEIMDCFSHYDAEYLPCDSRYRVTMLISFRTRRKADIDGFIKPVLDAITESGVAWDDDEQVDELMVYRRPHGKGEIMVLFEALGHQE